MKLNEGEGFKTSVGFRAGAESYLFPQLTGLRRIFASTHDNFLFVKL